jgi:hypothetical protein
VCPTLLAPEIEEIEARVARRPSAAALAAGVASSLERGGVMVVLDLEPILGVHVAARLHQWRLAHGVLLLPRWPYPRAVLPVDGLVHALIGQTRRLTHAEPLPNVVFVLDAERTRAVPKRSTRDVRADNRYRLGAPDLPNLAALRARGIRKVLKLSTA